MKSADLPIIVLAAGQSSRMRGRDKLLEKVGGEALLRRQVRIARTVTTGPVIVALPERPHPRYAAVSGLGATLLPVPDAAEGMGASLRTAFGALPKTATAAMLLLGDLPELTDTDLKTVLQHVDLERETLIWRGATTAGAAGHPIVFSASLFPAFAHLHGDNGGREIVAGAGDRVVLVPLPGRHARLDLDTPEDWAAWRASRCET